MTYMDIIDAIEAQTELPATYGEFKDAVSPPFAIVRVPGIDDLHADNANYVGIDNIFVELYTDIKYPPTEQEVEQVLKDLGLSYERSETPIEEESMYLNRYSLQII